MYTLIEEAEKRIKEEKREKALLVLERQIKIVEERYAVYMKSLTRLEYLKTLSNDELYRERQSMSSLAEDKG